MYIVYDKCTCTHTDNELPDYIMVMLVNKKTFHQISNDLQLFLGEHTTTFIDWLQHAVTTGNLTGGKKTKSSGTCACVCNYMYVY